MVILTAKCVENIRESSFCCRLKKRHLPTWNIWSDWGRSPQTSRSLFELTQSGSTWKWFSPVWSRVTHLQRSHGKNLEINIFGEVYSILLSQSCWNLNFIYFHSMNKSSNIPEGQNSLSKDLYEAYKCLLSSAWDLMCDINNRPTAAVIKSIEVKLLLNIFETNLSKTNPLILHPGLSNWTLFLLV